MNKIETDTDTENRLMKQTHIQRTKLKQTRRHRPQQRGEKVKGLESTNWQLQNSHRDVKYRVENSQ